MRVSKDRLTDKERSLLAFWDERRAGRVMPERPDILPEELFPWLGYLHLLEPIEGGADFRYGVFTTRTLIGKDKDMTGKRVSDWPDERAGYGLRLYSTVMEQVCPIYSAIPERYEGDWIVYTRVCLPLGKDNEVTHILAMLSPQDGGEIEHIPPAPIEM